MIRVLIAAPTPALRAGLRALVATTELQIAGAAATLAALGVDISDVDVLLLADEALLADAARIIPDDARLALLLLASDGRAATLLSSLPLAGWGILPLDSSSAELQAALVAVAHGLVALPLPLAEQLLGQRGPVAVPTLDRADPLTAREREVLQLVSQGLSNKLIARELQVSEHTVKFHVSSIFAKLGAASRTDAISRGARQGLITL
jgi:DNA-binding NarL/FixJ family response regulator